MSEIPKFGRELIVRCEWLGIPTGVILRALVFNERNPGGVIIPNSAGIISFVYGEKVFRVTDEGVFGVLKVGQKLHLVKRGELDFQPIRVN